jgi:hypothetical protein
MFSNRVKGNLTIWAIIIAIILAPLVLIGLARNIWDSGWFWGTIQVVWLVVVLRFFGVI